ncbi:MAG TPA: hypothetical protein VJ346_08540 [Bacteroidales bacterium]|nr:hypothetical protein [Bacteroidales bacterium]
MRNTYLRIISILLYVLLGIGLIVAILFYFGGVVPGTKGTSLAEPLITDKALILSYIYFGIAALLTLIFPVIYIITHPKKVKGALLSVLFFAVIMIVGYLLGSGSKLPDNPDISTTTMKLVDSGLIAAYIFLGLAFIGILYSEISSIFR